MNPRRVVIFWWSVLAIGMGVVLSHNYLIPFLWEDKIKSGVVTDVEAWILAPLVLLPVVITFAIVAMMIFYISQAIWDWLREE